MTAGSKGGTNDIESQFIHPNLPIAQGYPVLEATANAPVPNLSATTVYVIEPYPTQEYAQEMTEEQHIQDPRPRMLWCAYVGLLFSWIPIVGFVTFLFNLDAPKDTLRRSLARGACCISTFLFLLFFLFWPWWKY